MKIRKLATVAIPAMLIAAIAWTSQPTPAFAQGSYDDPAGGLRVRFKEQFSEFGPSEYQVQAVAGTDHTKIYLDRAESMDAAGRGEWQPWLGEITAEDDHDKGMISHQVRRDDLSDVWRACVGDFGASSQAWHYSCSRWVHGLPYQPGR